MTETGVGAPLKQRSRSVEPSGSIRILQLVATGGSGGAQEHVMALLKGLDRARFDVRVIALSDGSSVARWRSCGPPVHVIPSGSDDAVATAVAEHLTAWDVQVVHAHMYRAEVIAARAASRLLARGLARPWLIGHVHSSRIRRSDDQAKLRALDPSIDRLVAVSRAIEAKVRLERPSAPPVSLVYNGVDTDRFVPLGLPIASVVPRTPTIGCVARLEPEKGHETLLRAWVRVLHAVPRAKLMIVGEGSRLRRLRALAGDLQLPPNQVEFSGYHDDIAALTARFDIAVMPSYREAQGLAVLEAMAAGRPVVASGVGGITEMVQHERTGLLVPPADTDALAAAIVRLLAEPEAAERMGRAGRAVAVARFGVERMLSQVAALYEEGAEVCEERDRKQRPMSA